MAAMPMRPLGSQGMQASVQGYGCMGLTAFYGSAIPDDEGLAVLQKAFDLGVRHFDSAEVYVGEAEDGTKKFNEELVGKFAAKVGRDKITIATKYMPMGETKAKCEEEAVRAAFDASMQKLGIDCLDLYYLHRIPVQEGALENWMRACKKLVEEGRIKYLGLSEATADQIRAAHAIHPLTAVQQEWSLLVRSLEADVVPTCRELGIGIVAYSPMCRGFTSGQVKSQDDWSKIGRPGGQNKFQALCPHLTGDNVAANAALLDPLLQKAEELSMSPAQLSLAWVHAQGEDVFPIPGTTKPQNLESNVQAASLASSLDAGVFQGLSEAVSFQKLSGDRYPDYLVGACFDKK